MPDPPPTDRAGRAAEGGGGGPLTPETIDAVLAEFRGWLEALPDDRGDEPPGPPEAVDLFTLVAQFTALRHDVNLQTKAARAAVEALKQAERPADADGPAVKAMIDVADALAGGLKQVEKAMAAAGAAVPPKPGLLGRLFAPTPDDRLRTLLAGVADGYALSLRRAERALADAGLDPVECVGKPFDPEAMEVLEVVAADRPAGTVIEEVRRGYRRGGAVVRFALVKVAR